MKRVIMSAEAQPKYKVTFINRLKDLGVKRCNTIEEVYDLLSPYVHPKQRFILDDMLKWDSEQSHGTICSTSSYNVFKGEHQMTEYTSF